MSSRRPRVLRMRTLTALSALFFPLFLLLLILFFTLLFSQFAAAARLGPVKHESRLVSGTIEKYELHLINDQERTLSANIIVEGELAHSVALSSSQLLIPPGESLVTLTLTHPPARNLTPGSHEAEVTVIFSDDIPSSDEFKNGVALTHTVRVYRPHPGAYLDGSLIVTPGGDGKETKFTLSLENKGELSTVTIGTVIVSGPETATLQLGSREFVPGAKGKLETTWLSRGLRGSYFATAQLRFDDRGTAVLKEFSKEFSLGSPKVELALTPVVLHSDLPMRLAVPASLDWNKPVQAYVEALFPDGSVSRSATVTLSPPASQSAFQSGTFLLFLEPGKSSEGELRIVVHDTVSGAIIGESSTTFSVEKPGLVSSMAADPWRIGSLFVLVALLSSFLVALFLLRRNRTE